MRPHKDRRGVDLISGVPADGRYPSADLFRRGWLEVQHEIVFAKIESPGLAH
jgi:hypothetical protein